MGLEHFDTVEACYEQLGGLTARERSLMNLCNSKDMVIECEPRYRRGRATAKHAYTHKQLHALGVLEQSEEQKLTAICQAYYVKRFCDGATTKWLG